MCMQDIGALQRKYLELFGNEGVAAAVINEIEAQLRIVLPNDLKEVSTFYGGGILGGISHHAFVIGPANNVVQETLRIRGAIGLPNQYLVLAEPTDSLIVLDCGAQSGPAVIWCDAHDLERLPATDLLTTPELWHCYADFFAYLLEKEKTGTF